MPALLIHGGAGTIAPDDHPAYRAGLEAALAAGHAALERGRSALEAVLAAVTTMEDDPDAFDAGRGSDPNREGVVECDAAVMTSGGDCGAVASLTRGRNPVLTADRVRRETPHVMIVGPGADALVDDPVPNDYLCTDRSRRALARWRLQGQRGLGGGTVGALALDAAGDLAAATSTGGTLGKWPGRVGDSPLIGAGTYATRDVAISCTGHGEAFVRAVAAKGLAEALRRGAGLEEATAETLAEVERLGGVGGVIALTRGGRLVAGFNSEHLAYGWRAGGGAGAEVAAAPGVFLLAPG